MLGFGFGRSEDSSPERSLRSRGARPDGLGPLPGPPLGPPPGPRAASRLVWVRSQVSRCNPGSTLAVSSLINSPSMFSTRATTFSALLGNAYQSFAPWDGFCPTKLRLVPPRPESFRQRVTSSGSKNAISLPMFSDLSCHNPVTSQAHKLRP